MFFVSFRRGPSLHDVEQSLECFDMPAGSRWYDGVNKTFGSSDLETLVPKLVGQELLDAQAWELAK